MYKLLIITHYFGGCGAFVAQSVVEFHTKEERAAAVRSIQAMSPTIPYTITCISL